MPQQQQIDFDNLPDKEIDLSGLPDKEAPGAPAPTVVPQPQPIPKTMLGRAWDWGTSSVFGAQPPTIDEWADPKSSGAELMRREAWSQATSPLGMLGEFGAGIGLLKGLRGLRAAKGISQVGKLAEEAAPIVKPKVATSIGDVGDVSINAPPRVKVRATSSGKIIDVNGMPPVEPPLTPNATVKPQFNPRKQREMTGSAQATSSPEISIDQMPDLTADIIQTSKLRQWWDLSRGLKSVDLPFMSSAALRQGNFYLGTRAWREQFGKAARAYGSKAAANLQETERLKHPYFKPRETPILDGNGVPKVGADGLPLMKVEESLAEAAGLRRGGMHFTDDIIQGKELAEKIWGYGKHVERSNRAFTSAVNHLSDTAFTNLVDDFKKIGVDPEKDLNLAKQIAEMVNTSVKRGKISIDYPGALKPGQGSAQAANMEQHIRGLSAVMFSPRNMASEIRMLNPSTYWNAPAPIRQAYQAGMARRLGMWMTMGILAKMAGGEVVTEITNPDFGKIKIGSARFDLPGGLQQYLVLLAQNGLGGKTSSLSGRFNEFGSGINPTQAQNNIQFGINRLHPTPRYIYDLMSGKAKDPVHVMDRTLKQVTPMFADDVMAVMENNPELAPLAAIFSSSGGGIQDYEKGDKFNAPTYLPSGMDLKIP